MAKTRHVKPDKKHNKSKEIEELGAQIVDFDRESEEKARRFTDLPISQPSLEGLRSSHFVTLTDIQKKSLVPALQGYDILGAARTGSGKTLAFLIPVLDLLYRKNWNQNDGLGALIISPSRELAIQIFEVLRKVGRAHSLSAGLVIGGKDIQAEAGRISRLNIVIGTPGRILQHMDQTIGFDVSNLQILVLDEADRILDMGFKKTLDAIIENLPPTRQSLLYSATQTKTVSDLARLSLSEPKYISASEEDSDPTPNNLSQIYVVCELWEKLDTLFAFIKTHLKMKLLVFFSSSKQVRFAYETFRKLQPGIPLLHLHGKQKQQARIDITEKFTRSTNSCLFATDIVARGLDFPAVDWVIQVDCPEDAATYIHRVGRSARFGKKGSALLFLTPQEEPGMISELNARRIPIDKQTIKEKVKKSIRAELQVLCFKNAELKYLAQKAFISYVRSIYIQKNKEIFNVEALPFDKFAESLGLVGAPKVKIHGGQSAKEKKNTSRQLLKIAHGSLSDDDDEDDSDNGKLGNKKKTSSIDIEKKVRTKYDRMFERQNQNVLSKHYQNLVKTDNNDDNEDGDFMTVKRADHNLGENEVPELDAPTSKRQLKKALSKKLSSKSKGNSKKLVFDDEGNPHAIYEMEDEQDFLNAGSVESQKKQFILKESQDMKAKDMEDKMIAKDKRQEKKRRRQERARELNEEFDSDEQFQVTLAGERGDDGTTNYFSDPDLDRDMEDSDNDELQHRPTKKSRWFDRPVEESDKSGVLEVEDPQSLEDLEALSSKLLRKR